MSQARAALRRLAALALLLPALLLAAACQQPRPKPVVKTAQALPAADLAPGLAARPLALTPFRLEVPAGKKQDYYEVGMGCAPARISERTADISGEQPQQLLLGFVADALEDRGYRVDRSGLAEITLSASLVAYTTDICLPYVTIGDRYTGHGKVWLQVRWLLAERAGGAILLDRVTEGSAHLPGSVEQVSMELMRLALHQAAGNLLADPEVAALLAGPGTSAAAPPPATRAAPGTAPGAPSSLDPQALAGAQAAFDAWLAGNADALARAVETHLAALGEPVAGGVQGILGAAVRDVTPAGYLALLTYGTAAGPRQDLFQVTLNQGRLRAVELLR